MDRRTGDLIQSKGQFSFADFLSFIQKEADLFNNRFERELRHQRPIITEKDQSVVTDKSHPEELLPSFIAAQNKTDGRPDNA